jgi:large repetitive protein
MKKILMLLVGLFVNQLLAQSPNDCVNAITVCGNGPINSNANGNGSVQEVSGCGSFENNTLWIHINIVQGGTLGFELIPIDTDISVDYDFWVFGPNVTCGALGSPIRCNTTNPTEAGLLSNHTGMNGTSLVDQSGPGSLGNGYVRWLDVLPGQSYYVVLDRPLGNGGLQLNWTGTANLGTGAFPIPPTANNIPTMTACGTTPNVASFDLNSVRNLANANLVANTISFHSSIGSANDNIAPLPNLYSNTSNPQTLFVRVTDNLTKCFSISQVELVVNTTPTAAINVSTTTICGAQNLITTFSGTPNATFHYTINSGAIQTAVLNSTGTFVINSTPTTSMSYNLIDVSTTNALGTTICSATINSTKNVIFSIIPTVAISGTTTICNGNNANVTFTGTPNAVVTYTINGGTNQTLTLNAVGIGVINNASSITNTYNLVSVSNTTCSQLQNGTAVITVNTMPTATISGTTTINAGTSTTITFNGTPNAIITYKINGGANQTILLNASGIAVLNTPLLIANTLYTLVNVALNNCNQPQFGNALITTVIVPPTATIVASTQKVCLGDPSPTITFTGVGVPPFTFTYTLNGVLPAATVTTIVGNSVTLNVPTSTLGTLVYTLTNVQDFFLSNPQTGTVTVNVITAPPFNVPTDYVVCDDNAVFDGVGAFDLLTKNLEITTDPNLQISYHYTLEDAEFGTGANPINTALPFFNNAPPPNAPIQILYIRISDPSAPTCYSITQLHLIVKPRPLQNLALTDLNICDVQLPHNGTEPFDLHDKDADIINGQTGAVVNYYATQAQAVLNVATPAGGLLDYTIAPFASNQTIWYNVSFTSSGCGTVGPLVVKVNPIPTAPLFYPAFIQCEQVGPFDGIMEFVLSPSVLVPALALGEEVHFYPSPAAAILGTPGTEISGVYQNTMAYSQTLGVRITNVTTKCYALSAIDLIVNPLPNPFPLPVSMTSTCDDGLLGFGTFDLDSYSANIIQVPMPHNFVVRYYLTNDDAIAGQLSNQIISPYYTSNLGSHIIYVREENTLTGCYKIITLDLTVNKTPILPTVEPNLIKNLVFCDEDLNNQNQITHIDLTVQNAFLLNVQSQPASNYAITYYTTQADAQNSPFGTNPIVYANNYIGTNGQTIWVRIQDNITKCFNVTSFNLIINKPLVLLPPTFLKLCDDELAITPPMHRYFDLDALANPLILGASPLEVPLSVNYYKDKADYEAGNAPQNGAAFLNTSNPQTLYVVVTTLQGCRSFSQITLEVLPLPTPQMNPAELEAKCDDNSDNTSLGFEFFDVSVNANFIKNNMTNVTLSYYHTLADATANPPVNAIATPNHALVSGDVYIRVENNNYTNYLGEHCYVIVVQKLKVLALPKVSLLDATTHPNNTYQICQNPNLSTPAEFNLTNLIPELLINNPAVLAPAVPPTFTTTFYTTYLDADAGTNAIPNPSAYISTAAIGTPKTIYVRVINNQTGCVNAKGEFIIIVNPKPKVNLPSPVLNVCDIIDPAIGNYDNDGLYPYPLDILKTAILGATQATGFTVTFYNNLADAQSGSNRITNEHNYLGYTHSLWIRVENNLTGCYELGEQKQVVEYVPNPVIQTVGDVNTICVDYTNDYVIRDLLLSISPQRPNQGLGIPPTPAVYTYQWYEDGVIPSGNSTSATYLVNQAATIKGATRKYTVKLTSTSSRQCTFTSPIFEVIQSGPAEEIVGTNGYFITNAFTENQTITVTVEGYGTYQYSLDDGPRQVSPVFENVSLGFENTPFGSHKITIYDVKSGAYHCKDISLTDVRTIDYPHYFTPNGDGIQDFWNINGLKNQLDAKIYIFDRHGKLLKQIAPNGEGWDGTYNDAQLPSTDYWFTVDFTEQTIQKQFKAHFSLKR